MSESLDEEIMQFPDSYLSEELFHFWGKDCDPERQFEIFQSIVTKGFLLTCGNRQFIDRFQFYSYKDLNVQNVYLRQWARVCFTEVPQKHLKSIVRNFGGFGIGFKRSTILQWGGCPAWYLPNYYEKDTQYGKISVLMRNLKELLDVLQSMKEKKMILSKNNTNLTVCESLELINKYKGTLHFIFSHFKSMSPISRDDHSFLYEREWRVCFGVHYGPSVPLFRSLTEDEKSELVKFNPSWNERYEVESEIVTHSQPSHRIVDDFRWFNGTPDKDTVASKIIQIFVPNGALKLKVEGYIKSNEALFNGARPGIEVIST